MSDTNADQQEPSMEEILSSIRRIISEDGNEEAEGEVVAADPDDNATAVEAANDSDDEEAAPADNIDDDILELTNVIDDGQDKEAEPEPEPDPEPEPVEDVIVPDDKLISEEVEEVSAASMSGLTAVLAANAAIGDGNQTLENLVKDVLRPVLKQWLDDNLPEIVDGIVREEVERIAKRAK